MPITRGQMKRQLYMGGGIMDIVPLALTNVIVIVLPDPASSDTNNDLTTVVVAVGTVYNVVRSVVVKSTFLFLKLFAINLKRN